MSMKATNEWEKVDGKGGGEKVKSNVYSEQLSVAALQRRILTHKKGKKKSE